MEKVQDYTDLNNGHVNKKIGSQERAQKARKEIMDIMFNDGHPLYFIKDIDLAKKFDVSRLTIYKIREQLRIPSRLNRVKKVLKSMDTSEYTIKELSLKLNIKYQSLYKIVTDMGLPFQINKKGN